MKQSTLLDYKIAHDWAAQLVKDRNGSQISEPEKYKEAVELKKRAAINLAIKCKEFILNSLTNE